MTTNYAVEMPRSAVNLQAQQRRLRQALGGALRYLAIAVVLFIFLAPFAWMLLSSFKTQVDITNTRNIFNFTPTLENYQNVFAQYEFLRYLLNSFAVAALSTLFSLILGLPAAYAIARFRLQWLGVILLTARIVPGITFLIPWFIIFSRLELIGTLTPLILSHMLVGLPFIAWIMIAFYEELPIELEEAAKIDGATPIGAFIRVALPLSMPGVITAGIVAFIFSWNNFMFSLVLADDRTRTLPIAIFNFLTYASVDWGGLMAAAVVITLPVLIITLFVQRYIVRGLTAGATKADQAGRVLRRCATMCASAMIVSIGLTPEAVGRALASATNRLRTSKVSPSGAMAPRDGLAPMRQDDIWWALPRMKLLLGKPALATCSSHASKSPSPRR